MKSQIIFLALLIFTISLAHQALNNNLQVAAILVNTPKLINYQGRLTNLTGTPVPDSNYSVTFRLYTQSSGGSSFWSETQNITTSQGLFNVLLGSVNPIESVPQDGHCYLEMQVNPYPAMTPRIRLVSVPYSYWSKRADTANYALTTNIVYVDSSRIAANSHRLQGKDTLELDLRYINEGESNSITTNMIMNGAVSNEKISDNAITSAKIQNNTILREDVALSFKAPYADTADYVRYLPNVIDSSRVSGIAYNAHKLQGKDTLDLDNRYISHNESNTISSAMIIDGTITRSDVETGFKAPYADTSDYVRYLSINYVDSSRIAANSHRLQGKDTLELDLRYINEGESNSITTNMIMNGAVSNEKISDNAITSAKIQNNTILGEDIQKPLHLEGRVNWPNGIINIKNSGTGSGIKIDSAGLIALRIDYAFADGINIVYASQSAIAIDTVGGSAIRVISPSFDALGIDDAGFAALYAMHVGDNGVQIDSAESYGVYAYGNLAGGNFVAANPQAVGLEVHSYQSNSNDTAVWVYGQGYATGGWYTGGLFDNKSAPCVISPELSIITSGTGKIREKRCVITFDPLFSQNLREDQPVRVVVSPKGKTGCLLYVSETNSHGFVVELEEIPGLTKSSSEISFDWIATGTLKSTRLDYQSQWQEMIRSRELKKQQRTKR
jgi:phosphotransferase system IIA component